ncbi:MAG: glutaredoxin family protein [Candidatus Thorarchaeota archaeon]
MEGIYKMGAKEKTTVSQKNPESKIEPVQQTYEKGALVDPLKITVYTSDRCVFCKDALSLVEEARKNLSYYAPRMEVVESPIDENPKLVEKLSILAVPTIFVGDTRLTGIPSKEDLEEIIHKTMLTKTGSSD